MLLRIVILLWCVRGMTFAAADTGDRTLFQFDNPGAATVWRTVNDGVMGGRSVGRFAINADNRLEFFGNLSLENNGGFASVRARGISLGLQAGDAIVIRLRGDGREYKFDLYAGSYSFRQSLRTTKNEWIEVTLPVDHGVATWRGRVFPAEKLDLNQVNGLGILLGDKKPGPFKLEIEWIKLKRTIP